MLSPRSTEASLHQTQVPVSMQLHNTNPDRNFAPAPQFHQQNYQIPFEQQGNLPLATSAPQLQPGYFAPANGSTRTRSSTPQDPRPLPLSQQPPLMHSSFHQMPTSQDFYSHPGSSSSGSFSNNYTTASSQPPVSSSNSSLSMPPYYGFDGQAPQQFQPPFFEEENKFGFRAAPAFLPQGLQQHPAPASINSSTLPLSYGQAHIQDYPQPLAPHSINSQDTFQSSQGIPYNYGRVSLGPTSIPYKFNRNGSAPEDFPFPGVLNPNLNQKLPFQHFAQQRNATYPTDMASSTSSSSSSSKSSPNKRQSSLLGMTPETAARNRCNICHKQFKRPSSLQTHKYSHTGEKPFICDWDNCGKVFSVRSNMIRHKKLHERNSKKGNDQKTDDIPDTNYGEFNLAVTHKENASSEILANNQRESIAEEREKGLQLPNPVKPQAIQTDFNPLSIDALRTGNTYMNGGGATNVNYYI